MSEEIPRRKRGRGVLIPLLIGIPVLAVLAILFFNLKPEALSPDEILAKKEWNDQELTTALARSMSLTTTSHQRKKIQRHLSRQLKKRPPEVREEIRCRAIAGTVTTSLKQLRQMPEKDRNKMISAMQKKAEKNFAALVSSSKERKKLADQMQTREMQSFTNAVNKVIFSEFTPAERVQFAPITKIWIKTMKVMGK